MEEIEKIVIEEGFPEENYPKMLKWFQDLDVIKYTSIGKEVSDYKTINNIEGFFDKNKNVKYFSILVSENECVGYMCFYDQINNKCSIGILIGEKKYWGKGIGNKAMRLGIEYAFDKLNVKKVHLTVCDLHEKAQGLYKKLGFKTTSHIENDRKVFLDNEWIDAGTYHMELIKDNFYNKI